MQTDPTTGKPLPGEEARGDDPGPIILRIPRACERPELSPEAQAAMRRREQHEERAERERRAEAVLAKMGDRYENATLDNFRFHGKRQAQDRQRYMLDRMRRFAADLRAEVAAGRNLLLFGTMGAGKDHVLAALLREAVLAGMTARWENGVDLWRRLKDTWGTNSSAGLVLNPFLQHTLTVLAISDPLPHEGDLDRHEAAWLHAIVDFRARHKLPTWLTTNVMDVNEGENRFGEQTWDRLIDGAVYVKCDWGSWRQLSETTNADESSDGTEAGL